MKSIFKLSQKHTKSLTLVILSKYCIKTFNFLTKSFDLVGIFEKLQILDENQYNFCQMTYCCSISMENWKNQYPEILSVRRNTPDLRSIEEINFVLLL